MNIWEKLGIQRDDPNYPNGFKTVKQDARLKHPKVFDPALQHFSCGFRKGFPNFGDESDMQKWRHTQTQAMLHLLKLVSESKLKDCLVLRGSMLMQQWFGDKARSPHDIDWVVVPTDLKISQKSGKKLIDDMCELIKDNFAVSDLVAFDIDAIAIDDIWTYDRAPGKRIVAPWFSPESPPGFVQMDLVFEEELWCEPVKATFPNFQNHSLLTASPEQSLAWKILWLSSDDYPEGKDLYDAVLLAEKYPIDSALYQISLSDNGRIDPKYAQDPWIEAHSIDWEKFQLEYPDVIGGPKLWLERLFAALPEK